MQRVGDGAVHAGDPESARGSGVTRLGGCLFWALGMFELTGTISRPAWLLWKKAWMVELDDGDWRVRRTRVAERALRHVPPLRA